MAKISKFALLLILFLGALSVSALFYKTLVVQDFVIIDEPEAETEEILIDEPEAGESDETLTETGSQI